MAEPQRSFEALSAGDIVQLKDKLARDPELGLEVCRHMAGAGYRSLLQEEDSIRVENALPPKTDDEADILEITEHIAGGMWGVLESVLASPGSEWQGAPVYPEEIAATIDEIQLFKGIGNANG